MTAKRMREATERLLRAIDDGAVRPRGEELAALAFLLRKHGLHALAMQVASLIPIGDQAALRRGP